MRGRLVAAAAVATPRPADRWTIPPPPLHDEARAAPPESHEWKGGVEGDGGGRGAMPTVSFSSCRGACGAPTPPQVPAVPSLPSILIPAAGQQAGSFKLPAVLPLLCILLQLPRAPPPPSTHAKNPPPSSCRAAGRAPWREACPTLQPPGAWWLGRARRQGCGHWGASLWADRAAGHGKVHIGRAGWGRRRHVERGRMRRAGSCACVGRTLHARPSVRLRTRPPPHPPSQHPNCALRLNPLASPPLCPVPLY